MSGFSFPKDTTPNAKARVIEWQGLNRDQISAKMRQAKDDVEAMAPTVLQMQYQKYEGIRIYILNFIRQRDNIDLSEVQLLLVPRELGLVRLSEATGLYCKFADKAACMMWKNQLAEAKEAKRVVPLTDRLVVGKCVVMCQEYPKSPEDYLRACWILWHEFGHALNDTGRLAKGASLEALAYLFELQAILAALNDGTLGRYGITRQMIAEFLKHRVLDYTEIRMKDGAEFLTKNVLPLVKELCKLTGIAELGIGPTDKGKK